MIVLVQPVDSHDMEEMDQELAYIHQHTDKPFRLLPVRIKRWNEALTPWPAPPVFGKIPFGDGAVATLQSIRELVAGQSDADAVILGGYSLAGLFSLWAGTQHAFDGIVSASPSVWYQDWLAFAEIHPMLSQHVYLSLGDRESHSKTKIMSTVDDCIHRQLEMLQHQGIDSILEMNPGNHFQDNGVRTAKGFVWAMSRLSV
jgi:hypothetical protein